MYNFGSTIIKKHFDEFRQPNDRDLITNSIDEFRKYKKKANEEVYYIPFSPNREMTPHEIYTVKVSHAIYDINWSKTMSDIRFLQMKGCRLYRPLFDQLREFWKIKHNNKRQNFNMDQTEFFNDNVKRKLPHDKLHEIFNPEPSYKKIVNGVKPDKKLFDQLSYNEKRDICNEEAYVVACERFIDKYPMAVSYHMAQKLLVTKLHPEFIADFVINNWKNDFWTPKINYHEIYKKAIN